MRAAVAAAALLLAACPGVLRPLEKPTVELQRAELVGAGLSGLELRAHFVMTNPNNVRLPLVAVDWELSIGRASPVRGRADLAAEIPAKGSAPVVVDVHVGPGAAIGLVRAVSAGDRTYHLAGTLHFDTKLGDIAVAFDETGAL